MDSTTANMGISDNPSVLSLATVNSNGVGFVVYGDVAISNTGANYGAFYANFLDPAPTGQLTVSGNGPINLYLISTIFSGTITGNAKTNLQLALNSSFLGSVTVNDLQLAQNSSFQELVTANDYGTIEGCSFDKGLTITTTGTSANTPNSITQTYFALNSSLSSPDSSTYTFQLDAYTNYWVVNNCSTTPSFTDLTLTQVAEVLVTTARLKLHNSERNSCFG